MKKLLLLFSAILLSSLGSFAQNKWYVSPSAGIALDRSGEYFSSNITVGHYVGKQKQYRVDLLGSYIFNPNNGGYSISGLFTLGDRDNNKFYSTTSAGIGLQKWHDKSGIDLIIPLKGQFGYRFSNHFIAGLDIMVSFNLNDFRKHSHSSFGLFLGFKF